MAAPRPPSVMLPWKDDFRDLFDLASASWTPPSHIRRSISARGRRMTLSAVFVQPTGATVRVATRLEKRIDGWVAVEERAHFRFRTSPKGA